MILGALTKAIVIPAAEVPTVATSLHMEDYQVQTAIVVIMKTRDLIRVAPMLSA
jgi:hypothetical protein